jgi:hypothetical protein
MTDNGITYHLSCNAEMAIRQDNLVEPGDCFSLDQYESNVLGHLPHTKRREKEKFKYVGGTLAVDHGLTVIFRWHQ